MSRLALNGGLPGGTLLGYALRGELDSIEGVAILLDGLNDREQITQAQGDRINLVYHPC